jgi:Family of unknown function (DUF5662)
MSDSEKLRILRHIETVRNYMDACIVELGRRGREHDRSKLSEPEFETYARVQPLLRAADFGTQEYKDACKELGPALEHHQAVNRHHAEFFENGIAGMNLIDLLEMFCDWKASSMRSGSPEMIFSSIDVCQKRFQLSDELVAILKNTATWIDEQDVEHFAEES